MKGLLASPRRRRRLAWLIVALALAVAITILGVFYPNTSPTRHPAPFTKEPVQEVGALPKTVAFTAGERKEVSAVAGDFIATAVFRRRLAHSYDLVCPDFRQGLSRSDWRTGNIPVVPYPRDAVALMKWKLDYSYKDRVGLQVYLQPKPTSKVGGLAFNVELHRVGPPQHRRWLVDYWTPAGQQGPAPSSAAARNPFGIAPKTKAGLGAMWLVLPIGLVLGLMVSVPIVLGIRGWRRRVRADRAYNALVQRQS